MRYTPPYPSLFLPDPTSSGNPGHASYVTPDSGSMLYSLRSNPDHASTAHVLMSWGIDIGQPRDSGGSLIPGNSLIRISAEVQNTGSYFATGGHGFRQPYVWGAMRIYVEEFAPRSAGGLVFVRPITGNYHVMYQANPLYIFSGSDESPRIDSFTITADVLATPSNFYRVWTDLEGEIQAHGQDTFTNSYAIAQGGVRVGGVTALFSPL